MRLKFVLLTSAAILTLSWSVTTLALSAVDRTFSQLVELADPILIGTVTESSTTWGQGQQSSVIFTVVTLEDLEVVKGHVPGLTYEFRHAGGRLGDLMQFYEGMPRLDVGTRYLLFVARDTNVVFPTVGVGQGVFVVTPSSDGPSGTIQTADKLDVFEIENDEVRTRGTGKPLTVDHFVSCIEDQMLGNSHGVCQADQPRSSGGPHPLDCSDHPAALVCYKFLGDQSVRAVWGDPGSPCVPDAGYDDAEQAGRLTIGTRCHAYSSGDFRFFYPKQTGQVWIQYRYKQQRELLTEPASYGVPSYTVMVAGEGTGSCGDSEFVEENARHRGYPQWNEACGAGAVRKSLPGGELDLQPGGETTCYAQAPAERPPEQCLFYGDTWATTSYHLDMDGSGHGGQPWVDGWVQADGGLRVHVLSFPLAFTTGLEGVYFGPHIQGKDPALDHPAWSVWYQDILVTTTPLF
jgi:hypothetical protein